MANTTNRQASIDSRRVELEREISIRVPRFDTFVTEYSQNISTTGMFIVSEKPQAPGTTFSFEFSVADDWKLIRGKAQVVWTRYRDEGPERPPGMGVRFLEVDAQSRRLVRWIVEKHLREGGKPFELDELRSVIDQALEQVLDTDEVATSKGGTKTPAAVSQSVQRKPSASVRSAASSTISSRSDRRAWPLLLTAGAVLATVALLFWLTELVPGKSPSSKRDIAEQAVSARAATSAAEQDADSEGARSGSELAPATQMTPSADPGSNEISESPAADADANSGAAPIGSSYRNTLDAVTAWADAWSDQDTRAYLSAYAQSFNPPGGLSRAQWEAQRRERLARPNFIKVSISGFEMELIDNNEVRVTFSQSYRSDKFSDMVRKTMNLVWEQGTWKIASEAAV
jgi:uncharacterized protein (TIGR02266 family)